MTKSSEDYAIIGKSAHIRFPEMQATVTYVSETALRWETVGTDGTRNSGTEDVSYHRAADHLHFINWIEKDGFTVSQIIDSKDGTVKAYWTFYDAGSAKAERASQFVDGKFEFA